ncbi:glucose-6-phosphate dehydrogenase [Paenibacillus xerothermodurans]|uniref:Glucose-6-phosphate 1-dehydrogenase n=1 Tax=Paenibacillus xerothermodurans TaxID=1977292 RepID=A0A2W1N8H8_PAEXE|nr:glucose-6-phosphate dehydrogenase [Paenibacillus xerothermodurans]PZE20677.1 glucose-6-phosphate dehydrogenase [Paenibacillus xerothermodurans]
MESSTFVLFGATGDLAKRKIYPALYNLFIDGKLALPFSVIGLGRRQLSDREFQSNVEQSLNSFSRRKPHDPSTLQAFLSAFRYCSLNVSQPTDYGKLLTMAREREAELGIPENRIFYLSVAPEFFGTIATNIKQSGLGTGQGWKRLIIEKPFGHDWQSARELNEKLSQTFEEHEVYRIDHYLGKHMVQNLEVLEYANPMIHALWSNRYISNVQITASETVGVEQRAGYYDQAGAIRDMFQNHMLQLLMMLAMHLPRPSNPEEVRAKKKRVLEALRPLNRGDVAANVVRGQYDAGEIAGRNVVKYTEEPGIDPHSNTDTFIAARLWIDDYFWTGVPFYIRTGKSLNEKSTRIVVEFKQPLQHGDAVHNYPPNLLVIEIGPDEGMYLQLNSKDPRDGKIEPFITTSLGRPTDVPEAYENLIHDALEGEPTFFAHWDEVELAWKWVQPILEAFEANEVPLRRYRAGSAGPEASYRLLEQQGHQWWLDKVPAHDSTTADTTGGTTHEVFS